MEARQRRRTRDWLDGKLGMGSGGRVGGVGVVGTGSTGGSGPPSNTRRVRSASAGRDKRTEMAAR